MLPVLERFIKDQTWLDSLGDPLQKFIGSLFAGRGQSGKQVKNLLNGTWLGHPLHPVLTDVPVGAWVSTLVLDTAGSLTRNEGLDAAADLTLATGLTAAVGSAVTGWTDWSDTYGKERQVGLLHGLIMGSAVAVYAASLIARLRGSRSRGVVLSNTGLVLMSIGAYLGGDEVYDIGYGVNHTAFQHGPSDYVAIMPVNDLPPNTLIKADAKGVAVVLAKLPNGIFALDDTCVHAGCSLAGGEIDGSSVICPCHGSQFDLRDGAVINGPATMPEPRYDVRVLNGMIEVKQA